MWMVFSIHDRVAEAYTPSLVLARNENVASRMFIDTVLGEKSLLQLHPDDYELRSVGTFDEETGELVATPPALVISASAVLRLAESRSNEAEA